jgi:hypothetical protein
MGAKGYKPKLISQSRGKKRYILVQLSVGHWVDNKQEKGMVRKSPHTLGTNP